MNKKTLLSIGEMSKLTGASIKSLRYYEKINILTPAYVHPESGYRYYSFNQSYLVNLIMFCIELDIPLKELSQFIDEQENMDLYALLKYGKEVTLKKLKALEAGLKFINTFEKQLPAQEKFPLGRNYTRSFPEKHYYVFPYNESFDDADPYDILKLLMNSVPDYYEEDDKLELLEYGYLCEHSPGGVSRYVFSEIPIGRARTEYKVIPAGEYQCRQNDVSLIEHSSELFSEYLTDSDSFLAIETEVYFGKLNLNKAIYELRVKGI